MLLIIWCVTKNLQLDLDPWFVSADTETRRSNSRYVIL
jgi:hypothetical protein